MTNVLMANHYHLLVRTRQANLGRFMQRLNTSYALYSRYKHKKPGHRLEGRYKARLVQGDEYILTLTRYIHLNPVKVRAVKSLEKMEIRRCLDDYRWSSYRGYVDEKLQEQIVCYDILKKFGGSARKRCREYRRYVCGCLMDDEEELLKADGHTAGVGLAKAVAMELAYRLTGLSQRAIGARYGGVSSQAVSHARRRIKTEVL